MQYKCKFEIIERIQSKLNLSFSNLFLFLLSDKKMNASLKQLFNNFTRILSHAKNTSSDSRNSSDIHKYAFRYCCTTLNHLIRKARAHCNFKRNACIWCFRLLVNEEDYNKDLCTMEIKGIKYPDNNGFENGDVDNL